MSVKAVAYLGIAIGVGVGIGISIDIMSTPMPIPSIVSCNNSRDSHPIATVSSVCIDSFQKGVFSRSNQGKDTRSPELNFPESLPIM